MNRALFDVNVILDVLLDRAPHAEASAAVWAFVEEGNAEGLIAAHGITTIHYLVRKQLGNARTQRLINSILQVFEVAPVDRAVVNQALLLPCPDFEDAVTAAAAQAAGCNYILTRDPKGFRGSPLRVLTPAAASWR